MPTDLNLATIVTTIDAGDYAIFVTSAGNAIKIVKTDLMTEILGDNVTEADLDKLADVTASAAELNVLDGVSGSLVVADVNLLAGQAAAGLTGTELGYVNGTTSPIQTQLDSKASIDSLKFVKRAYTVKVTTGAGVTSLNYDADDILTAIGIDNTLYYVYPDALDIQVSAGSFSGGQISTSITTNLSSTSKIVSGSTYGHDVITIQNLTASTDYVITINITARLIP